MGLLQELLDKPLDFFIEKYVFFVKEDGLSMYRITFGLLFSPKKIETFLLSFTIF